MEENILEAKSFENLVLLYRKELRKIENGASPKDVFTSNFTIRMRRKGVWRKQLGKAVLTPKTRRILEENR